jgi:hypothetical protein
MRVITPAHVKIDILPEYIRGSEVYAWHVEDSRDHMNIYLTIAV